MGYASCGMVRPSYFRTEMIIVILPFALDQYDELHFDNAS